MSLFDRLRDDGDDAETDQTATDGGSTDTDDPFASGMNGTDDTDGGPDEFSMTDDTGEEYAEEELEQRVDEVEAELASVSSTVNTIRSENEEIAETVDEIEENVRKLLDVYEMVTRGINPFTDDEREMGGASDGSLGLFAGGENEESDELDDADSSEDDEDEEPTDFDDLKAEYEGDENDATTAIVSAEEPRSVDSELTYAERTLSDAPDAEKPYLRGAADGYVSDLLILEWLEHLVETAGIDATEGAIEYYESIRWVDEEAADQLRAFIEGFEADDEEDRALSIADHTQSLRYICQLSSSTSASVVLDGWNDESRRAEL